MTVISIIDIIATKKHNAKNHPRTMHTWPCRRMENVGFSVQYFIDYTCIEHKHFQVTIFPPHNRFINCSHIATVIAISVKHSNCIMFQLVNDRKHANNIVDVIISPSVAVIRVHWLIGFIKRDDLSFTTLSLRIRHSSIVVIHRARHLEHILIFVPVSSVFYRSTLLKANINCATHSNAL